MARGELGEAGLIPRLLPDIDVRKLPIGPTEAFVLSRVDGRTSDSEIALVTGLAAAEVSRALSRLASLGAVSYAPAPAAPKSGPKAADVPPRRTDSSQRTTAAVESGTHPRVDVVIPAAPGVPKVPIYDAEELEEQTDLDLDRRRVILDTYYQLAKLSHYELLQVPRTADKKAIKSAYFRVVGTFHPDRYFGKNLGSFKPKLEKIFGRVTEAHDTLTRAGPRAEYDRFLESQSLTRGLDADDDERLRQDLDRIQREIEAEARLALERASSLPPPPPPPGATPTTAPPPARSSAPPAAPRTPLSNEERRRMLARRLGRGSVPPPARETTPPPPAATGAREAAGEALRLRYEARLARAKEERTLRFVEQAEAALAAKNMMNAVNAARLATSLGPTEPALLERLRRVEQEAAAAMAEQYQEQGRYEERRGNFLPAAQAYEKALRGRPTATTYERAAHCLVEARAELRRAGELARKAVELAPSVPAYRITLARVYARLGMEASALGELERARTLDPGDDTIKDWIKRAKRGEL